jgi:tocopherol cyclase
MIQHTQRRWRALWQPDMYHGWGRTRRYFEGWYFKCVTADGKTAMAFIPGIAMQEDGSQHAFVQVMYGSDNRAAYHRYEAQDFRPDPHRFYVEMSDNVFAPTGIRLRLPDVVGDLHFNALTPWPKMLGAPGIMGWFSFVPFMQCFHGVVSMDHSIEGCLQIGGREVDFSGGRGYIEKDWGQSFPKAYVWMQTNHFGADTPVSLLASVAHIPFLGSHFIGFIGGFWHDGRLLRFATYTGARKQVRVADDTVEVVFKTPKHELQLLAHRADGTTLLSPMTGAMTGKISESLQARVDVVLYERGQRIFEGTGRHAGLEVTVPDGDAGILER